MKNPLTWLFGYSDTPNPDLVGRLALTKDEVDADKLAKHHKKLRRARAYIRLRKLSVRPLYNYQAKE